MDIYKQFSENIIFEKQFKKNNHIFFSIGNDELEYKEMFLKLIFNQASNIFLVGYENGWDKFHNWTLTKEFIGTGIFAEDDTLNWYHKYGDLSNFLKLDDLGNYKLEKELVDLDLILGLHQSPTLRIISSYEKKTVGYCGCGEVWFELKEFDLILKYLLPEVCLINVLGRRDNTDNLMKLKKILDKKERCFYLNCSINYFSVTIYAISDLIGEMEAVVFEPSNLRKTKIF